MRDIRATARNAKLASKAEITCIVAAPLFRATSEKYLAPYIKATFKGAFGNRLVIYLNEGMDGLCAAAPAVIAGASGSGGLLYPVSKLIQVLIEPDKLNKTNADLVDQSIVFAKFQLNAQKDISGYDF